MRSDYLPEDLNQLWKELAVNPAAVSADDLRREARRLQPRVRLRNWFASGVCCIAMIAYVFFFFRSKTTLERVGAALSIAGGANVIVQFLKRPARTMPEPGAIESVRFYRTELERQRDFHRGKGVFSWLLPVLPGPILFNAAVALDRPVLAPLITLQMAAFLLIALLVVPLNLRMARRYQRRLDALDASQRP